MLAGRYFENKLSSPSTEDEEDIDVDYDYQEVRSFDRSSAGSIPWAEDAIKQNQQEWERIENYFNSEDIEHLPTEDKELYREILEWRKFFPYANTYLGNDKKEYREKSVTDKKLHESNLESDNETLIENSSSDTLKSNKFPLENSTSLSKNKQQKIRNVEKQSAKSVNFPIKLINNTNIKTLSQNFAKDLRISSVPKSNKRTSIIHNNSFVPVAQNLQAQTIPIKIIQRHYPHPHPFYPSQSAKFLLEKYPNSIVTIEKKISPHSATYFRMPPVYKSNTNGKGLPIPSSYQNRLNHKNQYRYDNVGISRLTSRVSNKQVVLPNLPTLNVVHPNDVPLANNLRSDLRSISAINSKHYSNRQIKTISDLNRIEYLPSLSASNNYKYRP